MGLDMYAHRVRMEDVAGDLAIKEGAVAEKLHYWRKHHDLHGLMERIFRDKGGEGDFNCQPVRLVEKDLDFVEAATKTDALPPTTGFFFGGDYGQDDKRELTEDTLRFVKDARKAIKKGFAVYYDSWW